MEIIDLDKFLLFIALFLPGFIAINVYDLFVPNHQRDFSKSLFQVISYSVIYYALFSPVFIFIFSGTFYTDNRFFFIVVFAVALLIGPILLPILFFKISASNWLTKYIIHPIQKPWDWVFSKKEDYIIIITLQDESKITGLYGTKSFTSSFPAEEQIYLEKVLTIDEKGKPQVIEKSHGVLVNGRDIKTLEFFR